MPCGSLARRCTLDRRGGSRGQGPVAQGLERGTHNLQVEGSNPSRPTAWQQWGLCCQNK